MAGKNGKNITGCEVNDKYDKKYINKKIYILNSKINIFKVVLNSCFTQIWAGCIFMSQISYW